MQTQAAVNCRPGRQPERSVAARGRASGSPVAAPTKPAQSPPTAGASRRRRRHGLARSETPLRRSTRRRFLRTPTPSAGADAEPAGSLRPAASRRRGWPVCRRITEARDHVDHGRAGDEDRSSVRDVRQSPHQRLACDEQGGNPVSGRLHAPTTRVSRRMRIDHWCTIPFRWIWGQHQMPGRWRPVGRSRREVGRPVFQSPGGNTRGGGC